MQNKKNDIDPNPDLKHDTMEYAASSDGVDILDNEYELEETDEITAEELEMIDKDTEEEQEQALNIVETDRQNDDDVYFNDAEEPGEEEIL